MQIRLTAGSLPPNYCPNSNQEFYNLMFTQGYGTLDTTASIARVIISSTEPTADQRDYVWIRLNPTTGVYDRTYNYVNGKWVSPHPTPAASNERRMWVGALANLDVYDGGATGAVGDAAGPMWTVDTAFEGRFPLGAGTLGSGTVIANGTDGGNETVTITRAKLPAEKLAVSLDIIGQAGVGGSDSVVGNDYGSDALDGSGKAVDATATDISSRYKTKGQSENMGSGEALNIMPPYHGVYFIKRTRRIYYTPS